ncbi:MAG: hypothetical protein BGP06_10355 [Rhizobiales bacterium 65-9]|nr:enoyl-CoA hydratase/isomerase family protein [Hyphomicrobiales bacterium]OJY32183.1 MAG: hypothetical protein BGP06_10355 [Rhizobiales bacterium 65-9]
MSAASITVHMENDIATLTLNRPGVLNAFDTAMIDDIRDALRALRDSGPRALLFTGAGRAFCVGADLNDPRLTDYGESPEEGSRAIMDRWITPLVLDLIKFPAPTVAAVNGVAAGGGIGLALAADIVIAARSARFYNVFVPRLGLVPDLGMTWRLTRALGPARARAVAMLGEPFDAETAAAWGLIWKACDDSALPAEAQALTRRLAAGPPLALSRTREAIEEAVGNSLVEQLAAEARHQAALNASEDAREGLAAFREKREPRFRGR